MAEVVKGLKAVRNAHCTNFKRAIKQCETAFVGKDADEYKEAIALLHVRFDSLDKANLEVLIVEEEDEFMEAYEKMYVDSCAKYKKFMSSLKADKTSTEHSTQSVKIKTEELSFQKFTGDVRKYPRFKSDFLKYIAPSFPPGVRHLILRKYLSNDILPYVLSCEDSVEEYFKRLDQKYGDKGKIADTILDEIRNFPQCTDMRPEAIVELLRIIEVAESDLQSVGLESELSNSITCMIIEQKLSPSLKLEWSRQIMLDDVDYSSKFKHLLKFLQKEAKAIEYALDPARKPKVNAQITYANSQTRNNNLETDQQLLPLGPRWNMFPRDIVIQKKCFWHVTNGHTLKNCRQFRNAVLADRQKLVAHLNLCPKCLGSDVHDQQKCEKIFHCVNSLASSSAPAILPIAYVPTTGTASVSVLFDSGSTISLITDDCALKHNLDVIEQTYLTIEKVGGVMQKLYSTVYELPFTAGTVRVHSVPEISSEIGNVPMKEAASLFRLASLTRPHGQLDVLLGSDYASLHPVTVANKDGLNLGVSPLCTVLWGSHPSFSQTQQVGHVRGKGYHVKAESIDEFFATESMGVDCTPKCGNCRCGNCAPGSGHLSLDEERELDLIKDGLTLHGTVWTARYPWIKDPSRLPNNRSAAYCRLVSIERRLSRNPAHARLYSEQIRDMVQRGAARRLVAEDYAYHGPVFYLPHREVLKPSSSTTPLRIVMDPSASFQGHVLNNYWAKGPNMVKDILSVLLRFREFAIPIVGDIKKMYHSVKTTPLEHHVHRFLWRDMETDREPDEYMIVVNSFGDRPAGAIAIAAQHMTAHLFASEFPEATTVVTEQTYVDDIIDSRVDMEAAVKVTKDIEFVLSKGNFFVKEWKVGSSSEHLDQQAFGSSELVLGTSWDPSRDAFVFQVKINFSPRKRGVCTGPDLAHDELTADHPPSLTPRLVVSQINGIRDPFGFLTPFTLRAKLLVREMWTLFRSEHQSSRWDKRLPQELDARFRKFFCELFTVDTLSFQRCIMPSQDCTAWLVLFSDSSMEAFGCCAYARLQSGNDVQCRLVAAKSRVWPCEPGDMLTIVRGELQGAVLSMRMSNFIRSESRIQFSRVLYIVDSQIVRAMIQRSCHGFQTFVANRVAFIQAHSKPDDWYWVTGSVNIADWTTHGHTVADLSGKTLWQNGPDFVRQDFEVWPVRQDCNNPSLPETRAKIAFMIDNHPKWTDIASFINISTFNDYDVLIGTTSRILGLLAGSPTRGNSVHERKGAVNFWIANAQNLLVEGLEKNRYVKLDPFQDEDGIWRVRGRTGVENYLPILLPQNHRFSRLYVLYIHNRAHSGVSTTVSKVRETHWILGAHRIAKAVRFSCVTCRRLNRKELLQVMAPLPMSRTRPSFPFEHVAIDIFGPYPLKLPGKVTRGGVARVYGKAYGVIFNCLSTRAIYLDIMVGQDTEAFLMVFRRFTSIRGYPSTCSSDCGTQIVAADKELRGIVRQLDGGRLQDYGIRRGITWTYTSPGSPWQNGCSEALIKSVKRCLSATVTAKPKLAFCELQTVFFEVASLVNERPIGRHPKQPDDGQYLCPNMLLLGRATSRVPSFPIESGKNSDYEKFYYVESLVDAFWKKWIRDYFPSLVPRQKWHTESRPIAVGDICLIRDLNAVRGQWKLGEVVDLMPCLRDGKVRRVEIRRKNLDDSISYNGASDVVEERDVHNLVVICPVEELKSDESV